MQVKIKVQKAIIDKLNEQMKGLDEQQSKLIAGGYSAAAGFGSGQAQIAAGKTQIESAEKELKDSEDKLEDSRKAARENANIDTLLSLDTLSAMISAQNFSMPAGYIEDKSSHQWLVEVGDNFTNEKQLKNLVLTKIDGVGKIRVKDIADITVVDNQGDAYSKVNGENAILLSVFKGSTANTSTVSKGIQNSFKDLEKKYKGLSFTTIMNQGDYKECIEQYPFRSSTCNYCTCSFLKRYPPDNRCCIQYSV